MRTPLFFLFVSVLPAALLAGCGSKTTATCGDCLATPQPTVSMTMTDDPPAGVQVLFFQVSLTAATLTPSTGSPVSILDSNLDNPTPVQIDVTQLQAQSAFLGTASAPAGSYTGLNLTFANPQLVIFNQSDASLGSSCAVGTICTLTPTFDNNSSSLSFTSSPFPVTATTSAPLSFLIDFHLNAVIQSDLSVNLAAANGVSISQLPPATAQFGFLVGTVAGVSPTTDQFTMQFPWGPSPIIATTSSTTFNNFPASACATPGIGCLAQGQIVKVEFSGVGGGYLPLTASEVDYVQSANAQTVQGTIIQLIPSNTDIAGAPPTLEVLLHANPASATGFPLGGIAYVIPSFNTTTYLIDSGGFTMPAGLTFTGPLDLAVGQNVTLTVTPGTLTPISSGTASGAWGPPPYVQFGTTAVELEPSQLTGSIAATDATSTSFTLGVAGPFFAPWPTPAAVSSYNVVTTGQTTFTGFSPDSFSGLATNDFVSVDGWLFPPTSAGGSPAIAAQSVVNRPTSLF